MQSPSNRSGLTSDSAAVLAAVLALAVTLPAASLTCDKTGTPGPDVLKGTAKAERICGLGGDTIYGYGGK